MRRRVILGALSAGALGASAAAQNVGGRRRVSVLTPADAQWDGPAFIGELRRLGLRPGDNLALDVRTAEGDLRRLPDLARQAIAAGVEVIVAVNTPSAQAAIQAGGTQPIVAVGIADPVLLGLVSNFARPGGRLTGVANMAGDIAAKRLEILKETIPSARRVTALHHPDEPIGPPQIRDLSQAAPRLGIEMKFLSVRTLADMEQAMSQIVAWPADAILRLAGQGATLDADLSRLGLRYRLPTMALTSAGVRLGALLSYFADQTLLWRRAAHQVVRILSGDRPGDLPFERPTRFELAINLATSKALGIIIPPSILLRADEVIE
ncbi:MAG TPA: ABC transporter substrate-binding protein [Vineibacter sp.]|nr:ABC transporter substrate-binding protein [Vineibacter sp.]